MDKFQLKRNHKERSDLDLEIAANCLYGLFLHFDRDLGVDPKKWNDERIRDVALQVCIYRCICEMDYSDPDCDE